MTKTMRVGVFAVVVLAAAVMMLQRAEAKEYVVARRWNRLEKTTWWCQNLCCLGF